MKHLSVFVLLSFSVNAYAQIENSDKENIKERNKEIARNFYQDLWFTNNTDNYADYIAKEYVVHDIGDRKGITEPAVEQEHIADFFWENGEWDAKINYQIAEGDLVATRWEAAYKPSTLLGKVAIGSNNIPIEMSLE